MKTVLVLFFSGKSLIDRGIKYLTWSHYSHCGICLNGAYYDAKPFKGVRRMPVDELKEEYELYYIEVTDDQFVIIEKFLDEQVGKEYDYEGIARFILRTPPDKDDNEWFCSSLIFAGFKLAGVELSREKEHRVTPGDIAESPLLKRLGKVKAS